MFKLEASPNFKASGVIISGWSHSWQVYLASGKHTYAPTTLPPPFEAYGPDVEFVLETCAAKECAGKPNCKDYTLSKARLEQEFVPLLFKNYATVFGATRNKRVALSTKKRKAAMQEDSTDEEEEQQQDMDAKSEESQSSEESSESEQEQEEDESEEEQQEEEEEEEEEPPSPKFTSTSRRVLL